MQRIIVVAGFGLLFGLTAVVYAAFPGITYDMWCDFEGLSDGVTVTPTTLGNSTHGAAGTWTVNGSLNAGATNREDTGHGTTGDTGVIGMSWDGTVGTGGTDAQWALPTAKTTMSFGVWYRTGNWTSGTSITPIRFVNSGSGSLYRIQDRNTGGTHYLSLLGASGDPSASVSDDSWYWVTGKYIKLGTVSLSVYDTSLTLLYSQTYTDAVNANVDFVNLGNNGGTTAMPGSNKTTGFDDFIIDYTSATFPLLPATDSPSFQLKRRLQ